MTSEELVEKVAKAMDEAKARWPDEPIAAISIVVEECAKIAEGSYPFDIDVWRNSTKKEMTAHLGNAIAAAIRALLPKENEP